MCAPTTTPRPGQVRVRAALTSSIASSMRCRTERGSMSTLPAPRSGPSNRTRLMMPAMKPLTLRMRLQRAHGQRQCCKQAASVCCGCARCRQAQHACRRGAANEGSTPAAGAICSSAAPSDLASSHRAVLLRGRCPARPARLHLVLTPGLPRSAGPPHSWPPRRSALQGRGAQLAGTFTHRRAPTPGSVPAQRPTNGSRQLPGMGRIQPRTHRLPPFTAAVHRPRLARCARAIPSATHHHHHHHHSRTCTPLTLDVVQQDLVHLTLAQVALVKQAVQLGLQRGRNRAGQGQSKVARHDALRVGDSGPLPAATPDCSYDRCLVCRRRYAQRAPSMRGMTCHVLRRTQAPCSPASRCRYRRHARQSGCGPASGCGCGSRGREASGSWSLQGRCVRSRCSHLVSIEHGFGCCRKGKGAGRPLRRCCTDTQQAHSEEAVEAEAAASQVAA